MSDTASHQAEEIAYHALKFYSAAERPEFLERSCLGDPALRAAVEQVVKECLEVEQFLTESRPTLDRDAEVVRLLIGTNFSASTTTGKNADQIEPLWIGPYKLLHKLGEGGLGAVYLADQEKPVRRRVALKIIRAGMDTKSVIARFEAERQALAMMNHPNIARVLDAGVAGSGRPYFVMELVHGTKITTHCDVNRLDVKQRLELFTEICSAVQHAHQKGVVHRDLKPSNILVTMLDSVPLPKVIDFGIAKATGGEPLTDKTLSTVYGQLVGTPAYMSPEQAQMGGIDVDTRSDIYSLGVLLYELLTGKTPFNQAELLETGLDGFRNTLIVREPPWPSTRVRTLRTEELNQTAECRHVDPPKLKSLLNGDLDWIVMKALEKDRNRRYQTANGLAMDVHRYLNHEPVIARPTTRWYRLQTLVRRNRTTFAAITAVAMALLFGFGTSTWLLIRERKALHEADLARGNEMSLRAEADARAKIAQAALLLDWERVADADALMKQIQVPSIEPSLEAAQVFQTLANWNVARGRWKVAADCYLRLEQANQLDTSNKTIRVSEDLLGAGPAMVVAGEVENYRHFIDATLTRFAGTTDPVVAERLIKSSLIRPADDSILRQLEPFVQLVKTTIAEDDRKATEENYFTPWRALAMALYEFRSGNSEEAVFWGRRSLKYSDQTDTRTAMAHLVLAMSFAQLNQLDNARSELAAGRGPIESTFPDGPTKIADLGFTRGGVWHDWVIAYLLLQEAGGLVR